QRRALDARAALAAAPAAEDRLDADRRPVDMAGAAAGRPRRGAAPGADRGAQAAVARARVQGAQRSDALGGDLDDEGGGPGAGRQCERDRGGAEREQARARHHAWSRRCATTSRRWSTASGAVLFSRRMSQLVSVTSSIGEVATTVALRCERSRTPISP